MRTVILAVLLVGCSSDGEMAGRPDARVLDGPVAGFDAPRSDAPLVAASDASIVDAPRGDARAFDAPMPPTPDATAPDATLPDASAPDAALPDAPEPNTLEPTPSSVAFGDVANGDVVAKEVTVTNIGETTTGPIAVVLTDGGTVFTLTPNNCPGRMLAHNAICKLTVNFAPDTLGNFSATVTLTATPGGVLPIAVSAHVVRPALLGGSSGHEFGNVAVGMSKTFDFRLENTGGQPTGPISFMVGGDTDAFSATTTCPEVMGQGTFCTFTVTFAPTTTGNTSAQVMVSATPGGTVTFGATGTGIINVGSP